MTTPSKRGRRGSRLQVEAGWVRLEPGDELVVTVPGKGRFRTRIVERLDERSPGEQTKGQPDKPAKEATQEPKPKKRRKRKRDLLDDRLPGSFGTGKRR
jgi:hypothetical protein